MPGLVGFDEFEFGNDFFDPYITLLDPASGATASIDGNITIRIRDDDSGLDLTTAHIEIDFGSGYSDAYNASTFVSPYTGTLTEIEAVYEYNWEIEHPAFENGQIIYVRVYIEDDEGNHLSYTYSYTTVASVILLKRIGTGIRGQIAIRDEYTWGTSVPPMQLVDFNKESFQNEMTPKPSESINGTRGISRLCLITSDINGDIEMEQATVGQEQFYKHALGYHLTIPKSDGGVRTYLTNNYISGTSLIVNDTSGFEATPSTNWALAIIYKDENDNPQYEIVSYSSIPDSTHFTITDPSAAFNKGAFVIQVYIGTQDYWDEIYTHYLECNRMLPQGLTIEIGRDVVFFVYSGCKVNNFEDRFVAQERLSSTFSFAGKSEFSGGDLYARANPGDTTIRIKNHSVTGPATPTIGEHSYIGYGLDDFSISGTYTGISSKIYIVQIDSIGATDTFRWSNNNGKTWYATDVDITSSAQFLEEGVSITFTNVTGHNHGDIFYFQTDVPNIVGFNPEGGTIQIGSENGIKYTSYDTVTGVFSGVTDIYTTHFEDEPIGSQKSWNTPRNAMNTNILSSYNSAIEINEMAQEVLSASVTLSNTLNLDKYQLGDKTRAGLPEQNRFVNGALTVEFDDIIHYRKFINSKYAKLEITCVNDINRIDSKYSDTAPSGHEVYEQKHYVLNRIKYTASSQNISDAGPIVQNLDYIALLDVANKMNELAIFFVNTRPII